MQHIVLGLCYALSTLFSLWAWGGGNFETMWSRQLVLALALFILVTIALMGTQRLRALKPQLKTGVKDGVILGAGLGLLGALAIFLIKSGVPGFSYFARDLAFSRAPLNPLVFVGFVISILCNEVFFRFTAVQWNHAPAGVRNLEGWMPNNMSFLEALTIGIASQRLSAFLGSYFVIFLLNGLCHGYDWKFLRIPQKIPVGAAFWARLTLSVIIYISLSILG